MKFFILSKKDDFDNDLINDSILSSTKAPSLISKNFIKKDMGRYLAYVYTYDHIYDETENKYYKIDDSEISLLNGLISVDGIDEFSDVGEVFDAIRNDRFILGDFQAISINADGSNIVKTSPASIFPLFYYEDEYCSVISNELKLIVDGIKKFKEARFVDFYDFDYIRDLFFFNDDKKGTVRNTIFKNIKRILPYDELSINDGTFVIKQNSEIPIPQDIEELYLRDSDEFYDWYYDSLMEYADFLINQIKDGVDTVKIPITGGFDSRLELMIFSKLALKYDIRIITHTNGSSKHPDVIIGSRVAEALGAEWNNFGSDENDRKTVYRYLPQHFNEYASTFYASQGDFNSYDYITYYSREIKNPHEFLQLGNDLYKREDIASIAKQNRWSSRRRLFESDFYFPLFSTSYELYIAMLNRTYHSGENYYKDFVYNVIKRCEPELLDIPFAYDSLPQVDVGEFKSEGYVATVHKVKPFLWDYDFVLNELDSLFKPQFDKKDSESDNILSNLSINSLDYFILKDEFDKLLNDCSDFDEGIKIRLLELKENAFYPKTRAYFDLNDSKNYYREWSLLKLMDFASAASFTSFDELEKACGFGDISNDVLNVKEEVYAQIADNKNDNITLEFKTTLKRLAESFKLNDELMSSSSWKATKPLRSFKNVFKK